MKSEIAYTCATTDVADQVDRSYQQAEHRVAVDVTNKYKVNSEAASRLPASCTAVPVSIPDAMQGVGARWVEDARAQHRGSASLSRSPGLHTEL